MKLKAYGWFDKESHVAHSYIFPKIQAFLPSYNVKILDIGCGNGSLTQKLADLGHKVVAIDASSDGIKIAQKEFPNITFYNKSVYEDLSFLKEMKFDFIVSSEVIEHLMYPKCLINKAFELLKPGGNFILTTPYHGYLKNLLLSVFNKWDDHFTVNWDGGHIKFFSEKTLIKMLNEEGFVSPKFKNAGRLPLIWKSIVCMSQKPK